MRLVARLTLSWGTASCSCQQTLWLQLRQCADKTLMFVQINSRTRTFSFSPAPKCDVYVRVCVQVLVFTDVGMEPQSRALASIGRLARSHVLVMNNGQTSGMPAHMDWYLSTWSEQPTNRHASQVDGRADGVPCVRNGDRNSSDVEPDKPTPRVRPRLQAMCLEAALRLAWATKRGDVGVASASSSGIAGGDRSGAALHYSETLYMFKGGVGLR